MTEINKFAITLDAYHVALNTAEQRWFDGREAKTIAAGIVKSDDIADARKWLSAQTVDFINGKLEGLNLTGEAYLQAVANQLGVKAQKRMIEFFNALHAENYRKLDGVTVLDILACAYAGAVTRDALTFAATGKGNEHTSSEVKNLDLVRKLQKHLPVVGSSTEPTQHSRSFGKNGFCHVLNLARMGKDDKGNKRFFTNEKNPLFVACAKMIDKASDSTLELIKGGKASKRSK